MDGERDAAPGMVALSEPPRGQYGALSHALADSAGDA
jgi:hypothetical protein